MTASERSEAPKARPADAPKECEVCGLSHPRTPSKDLEMHGWWRWNPETDEWDVKDADAILAAKDARLAEAEALIRELRAALESQVMHHNSEAHRTCGLCEPRPESCKYRDAEARRALEASERSDAPKGGEGK